MSDDLIAEAITEAFGERCPDYEPECFCCKAWKQYDALWKAYRDADEAVSRLCDEIDAFTTSPPPPHP